jgi:hypothetical protein
LLSAIFAFLEPALIEISQWTISLITINLLLSKFKKQQLDELELLNATTVFIGHYQLFHSALIGGFVAFLVIWLCRSNLISQSRKILPVIAAIPLLICLSIEVSFIAGSHDINLPYLVPMLLLLILLGFVLRKSRLNEWQIATRWTIPLTLAGIAILHIYHPIIDQPTELFEYANKVNPLMRWQFGELPFVDHISSHLISDYFWSALYASLHGYAPKASMLIYDSFSFILGILAIYFLLRQLFPTSKTILWFLLLSPGLFFILPAYYALVCWPLGLFIRLFNNPTKKNTLWFYLSVCILTLWRLDIGVSLIIASAAGTVFMAVKYSQWIKIGVLALSIVCLPLMLIGLVFALNYPDNIEQIIGYFGANQAHGFSVMTLNESNLYWIDYFLLPFVITLIVLYNTLADWKKWTSLQGYLFIASAFYLFNLQRGMVRHSFVEGYDTQILSIGWSVLIVQLILWLQNRKKTSANHLMLVVSFTLPFIFSIAQGKQHKSIFQLQAGFSLKDISLSGMKDVDRLKPSTEFDLTVKPTIDFLRKNLKSDENFLDFSNSPMLYFYTEKRVPSYFNQYLQNTVSNNLQRINLKLLHRKKPKYVVFSQVPEGYFDNSDGIPNKVRYHLITTFIFKYYQPFDTIGKFRIWELKGHKQRTASLPSEQWNLGQIPFFWKPERSEKWEMHSSHTKMQSNEIQLSSSLMPGSFLRMRISSAVDQAITVHKTGFSLSFDLKSGTHTYHLPLGMSENCVYSKEPILLNAAQPVTIKTIQIVSLEPQ